MASSPSRIPVPTHHSRAPVVLGSALPPVASLGMTSSSSMPSVAVRALGHASDHTANKTILPAGVPIIAPTLHTETSVSEGDDASRSIWHDAVIDGQAWGKIERLRTRRVHSEGSSRPVPPVSASTSPVASPLDRPRGLGVNISPSWTTRPALVDESFRGVVPSSGTSVQRLGRLSEFQPDAGSVRKRDQLAKNVSSEPKSVVGSRTTLYTLNDDPERLPVQGSQKRKSISTGELQANSETSPARTQYPARSKLVSSDNDQGISLLALGFQKSNITVKNAIGQSSAPLRRNGEVPVDATPIALRPQESADHAAHDPRDLSMLRAEAPGQRTKNTLQIASNQIQSTETPSTDNTNVTGGLPPLPREIALNSPEILDTLDSRYALPRIPDFDPTVTTAQKRHQPPLRLVSMPNAPIFHAPGIETSARSPGSGGSPPIPAKNPLRKRSGAGNATLGSRASTPGLSSISTCNVASDIHGETSKADSQVSASSISDSTVPPPKEVTQAVTRLSGPGRATSETLLVLSPDQLYPRDDDRQRSPFAAAQGTAESLKSGSGTLMPGFTGPPAKRLPDPPIDCSPALSDLSTDTSRLEDVREAFPELTSSRRTGNLRIPPEETTGIKPTKSPSCPSFPVISANRIATTRTDRNGKSLLAKPIPRDLNTDEPPLGLPSRHNASHMRSQSNPSSPANPNTDGSLTASASGRMSKRAHLIHEIVNTERLYAQDLALVRDAYLSHVRPSSHHSTTSSNASKNGGFSLDSRHTAYTFDTAGTNATSLDSPARPNTGDLAKLSPNATSETNKIIGFVSARLDSARSDGSSNSSATANAAAVRNVRQTTIPLLTDVMSAADIKTVFLNIEQLATFSDSLASSFENAVGDGSGLEPIITENASTLEVVVDRLGAVFQAAIPQIRSLYTFYCSRSGQADVRLAELMRDPTIAKALQNGWDSIQPFTHAWDLASLLIKPVQRIMKYPMLFKELLAATTPAHPDYFNLKQAAASASSVADDINEVKRRKDLVEKAISQGPGQKHTSASSPTTPVHKEARLSFKLTKRFSKNKEKEKERASPLVGSLSHLILSPASEAEVTKSIRLLESSKACVQQLGEEIERFPEMVRHYWFTQLNVATAWHQAYTLDTTDMIDRRLQVYRNMMELILKYPYVKLNKDIKYKVTPVLSVLHKMTVNPLAVVSRLMSRKVYYKKVQTALAQNDTKNLDKETIQNAEEYVSLHAQLLEELPLFLEGMEKLLEILLGAFSLAQKDYYNGMQAHIKRFFYTVKLPVWGGKADVNDPAQEHPESGPGSVPDGTTIMRIWYNAWTPEQEGIQTLGLVSGTGSPANSVRLAESGASHSSLPLLVSQTSGLIRPASRNALRAPLSRNSSFTSSISNTNRARSSSLLASTSSEKSRQPIENAASALRPHLRHNRTQSTSSVNLSGSSGTMQSHVDLNRPITRRLTGDVVGTLKEAPTNKFQRLESQHGPATTPLAEIREGARTEPPSYELHAGQGQNVVTTSIPDAKWEVAELLYRCVCVANFRVFSHVRYERLPFLTVDEGDVIDILFEVGRVDELPDIPIHVGVDDDGLLVARTASKRVGLILCSFLEPLGRTL